MVCTFAVPLDGSEFSALALPAATDLAATTGASVRAIGIAPTDAELAWTYDRVHDHASVAGGLEQHLTHAPARLLVLGGAHRRFSPRVVARHLLGTVTVALLDVNRAD